MFKAIIDWWNNLWTEGAESDEWIERLIAQLRLHEGVRHKPYTDTVGKLTIGVGRNLTDVGLREDEIDFLLLSDIEAVMDQLDDKLPWWRTLDPERQLVLADMCFNLGIGGLLGFKNTLAAIERGDYAAAREGMLNSKWATQVKGRAVRLANMMHRPTV